MKHKISLVLTPTIVLSITAGISAQQPISLVGFKGIGVSEEIVASIAQRIESKLPQACNCPVISQEELDGSMLEYLSSAVHAKNRTSASVSSKVEKVVTGTLSKVGPSYSLVLKLIDVSSGVIEYSMSREYRGSIEGLFSFTDNSVEALFRGQNKPAKLVDTVFIASSTLASTSNNHSEKEVIVTQADEACVDKKNDQNATHLMEKIGIGAIAIFACIAAILLTNTTTH